MVNVDENISKDLRNKYSQKLLGYSKKSAADALRTTSKKAKQKTVTATSDLIGNKIADKIKKNSSQNNSDTVSQLEEKLIEILDIYHLKKDNKLLMS